MYQRQPFYDNAPYGEAPPEEDQIGMYRQPYYQSPYARYFVVMTYGSVMEALLGFVLVVASVVGCGVDGGTTYCPINVILSVFLLLTAILSSCFFYALYQGREEYAEFFCCSVGASAFYLIWARLFNFVCVLILVIFGFVATTDGDSNVAIAVVIIVAGFVILVLDIPLLFWTAQVHRGYNPSMFQQEDPSTRYVISPPPPRATYDDNYLQEDEGPVYPQQRQRGSRSLPSDVDYFDRSQEDARVRAAAPPNAVMMQTYPPQQQQRMMRSPSSGRPSPPPPPPPPAGASLYPSRNQNRFPETYTTTTTTRSSPSPGGGRRSNTNPITSPNFAYSNNRGDDPGYFSPQPRPVSFFPSTAQSNDREGSGGRRVTFDRSPRVTYI